MIDYDKFEKSLTLLEKQYHNYLSLETRAYLSEIDKEAIAESVIQRFETCYDTLWKVLKRYLSEEMGLPEIPSSPKPIFRIAAENNLFNGEDARKWLSYANLRIDTSHDYSGSKAANALAHIGDFVADAQMLYRNLTR